MKVVRTWIVATIGALGAVACSRGNEVKNDPPLVDGIDAADNCGKVALWIEQHRSNLPNDYAEIVQFPPQYRRAIFAAHSPIVESGLFRVHLDRYGQDHPLTSKQRTVLEHIRAVASPELYAISPETAEDEAARATLRDLELDAVTAFGREEAGVAMADLSLPETGLSASVPAVAFDPPFCDCSVASDYCVLLLGNKSCTTGIVPCKATVRGCGLGLYYSCNGFCTER